MPTEKGLLWVCAIYGQQQSLVKTREESRGRSKRKGKTICNLLEVDGLDIGEETPY